MTPSFKIYFDYYLSTVHNYLQYTITTYRTILLPKEKHIIRYKWIIFLFLHMEEGFIFLMIEAQWYLTPNVQNLFYGIILTPLLSSGTTLGIWNHWCLKFFSSFPYLKSAMFEVRQKVRLLAPKPSKRLRTAAPTAPIFNVAPCYLVSYEWHQLVKSKGFETDLEYI